MKADISSEVEGRGVEEEVTLPSLPRGLASLEIRTVFDQPELEALGRYDLIFTYANQQSFHKMILPITQG